MRHAAWSENRRRGLASHCVTLAILLCAIAPARSQSDGRPEQPVVSAEEMAEYRRKLEEYTRAHQEFEAQAAAYWAMVADKRRLRASKRRNHQEIVADDYVLVQPPIYSGPPKPRDPSGVESPPPPRPYVPVIADFLRSASEQFDFVPQRPQSEIEFKQAYAWIASAAGLTREQVVRIYAFEAGGNGTYDVQAGLEVSRRDARAITTALGYNQLLATNSVELVAEQGDRFVRVLKAKASTLSGEVKAMLERKIEALRRMINVSRTVPDRWSEHERLAATPQGLGIHALNLDVDIGPLLQTQKLLDSVLFARRRGYAAMLTAAELETMNLTGDGNGFDMIMLAPALRDQVVTANFFQRSGYQRNPIAVRNNTVARLLAAIDARMDREVKLPGARDLASAF